MAMTEDDAKAHVAAHVSRETFEQLCRLADLVVDRSGQQNLVATSTLSTIWTRHILDSAQLAALGTSGSWIDIGSGAGFPGLVIAIMLREAVTLVESRRLRAAFLQDTVVTLDLGNAQVHHGRIETLDGCRPNNISARAVAPLHRVLAMAEHLAGPSTTWILPKGRSAASELAEAQETWQGEFVMHPSLTDPDAAIVVARDVKRRTDAR